MWYKKPKIAPWKRPISCRRNRRRHHNWTGHDYSGLPPYSPDLASCNFWPNSYIKNRLVEQPNVGALHASITEIITPIPKFEYQKTFNKWLERMRLCINLFWTFNKKVWRKSKSLSLLTKTKLIYWVP